MIGVPSGSVYSLLPAASETGDEEGTVAVTAAGKDALRAWPVFHITHPVTVGLEGEGGGEAGVSHHL